MPIFKLLSLLLTYPEAEWRAALPEMLALIESEQKLPAANQQALSRLCKRLTLGDLLEQQEAYVALFDQGRFLSLHLFEHVHGESRDRGQAMVNLLEMYQTHGFELDCRELPDYVPLFLEFLAQLTDSTQALELLNDAMPVLALLGARLHERGSDYAALFDALSHIADAAEQLATLRQQVKQEGEDQTLVNIDAIWEEEAVSFMVSGDQCANQAGHAGPVTLSYAQQFAKMRQAGG